jgi:hypothetical protein
MNERRLERIDGTVLAHHRCRGRDRARPQARAHACRSLERRVGIMQVRGRGAGDSTRRARDASPTWTPPFPSRHYLAMSHDHSYPAGRARSPYYRAGSEITVIFSGAVRACIVDYVGSVEIITQLPKPTTAADCRSVRAAYQTCFTWLTRPREGQEMLELSQAQCTCGSAASNVSSHQAGLEVMKRLRFSLWKPYFVLADRILRLFCINMDAKFLTGVQETHQRVHRLLRRRTWPGTWQEMLPHGPKDTVLSLLSLLDATPPITLRYSMMTAIGRIVRHCHPLVLPILITSPGIVLVISGIVKSVSECQRAFMEQGRSNTPDIRALVTIKDCLSSIASFLLGLFKFSHETQRITFHVAGGSYLLKAYSVAALQCQTLAENNRLSLHESITAESSELVRKFGLLGGWMYDDWPDSRKQRIDAGSVVQLFDQRSSHQTTPKDHTWLRLLGLFQYLGSLQQCALPGCSYTLIEGPLRQCAGCVRVAYCSRACQKRAWKHAIPHRSVCSVLAQLQKELQLPHGSVDPEEPIDSVAWLPLANSALDHFARLVMYDMELLGERAIAGRHPDPDIPPEVNSNQKNAQPTVDGGL